MTEHKHAAAGICPDQKKKKKREKGAEFCLCFHLKTLAQGDTKQGCSNSLPAAQGAFIHPLAPPASSAHPRVPRCWRGPTVG